jgi:hypothetical protein
METVFDIIQFEAPGTMFIVDRFERLRVVLKGAGHHKYNPGNEAKFIVDGEELEDISHIKPEQVKSLKIIKGHNATFAGSEVSYGVIKIELKKEKKLEG